ncbi:MAG: phosphatase PAP2 family protein [Patescibacteria group bacterium]
MNESVLMFLNTLANSSPLISRCVIFCAEYLGYVVLVAIIAYGLFGKDRKTDIRQVLSLFAVAALAWVLVSVIKHFFPSPRPFEALTSVHALYLHGGMDSFPSGHASFFGALAFGTFHYSRKIGWLLLITAIIIGLARVASGIHFPLDILGGFAVAGIAYFLWRGIVGFVSEKQNL